MSEVSISKDEIETNIDINILSPENWLTIWEWKITISWNTNKNFNVKISVNWSRTEMTTSNWEWLFEKTIENLENWDNIFKAQVLNSDNEVIWESDVVKVKVSSNLPVLKNFKITPEDVNPESEYEIEVIASKWLTDVNVIINDSIIKLEESDEWVYTNKAYSPKNANSYKVDITLKNELWLEIKELWAWNLIVSKVELKSAEKKVNNDDISTNLAVKWLKLVKLKSKSVLSWDKLENAESYNVYKKSNKWDFELLENINTNKYEIEILWDELKYDFFAIKAIWKTSTWEIFEWNLSEATKIQTWPEIIILLILSLLVWSIVIFSRSKKS